MQNLISIIVFAALLSVKHFFADFVFQTNWMVTGKGREKGWFVPLLAHASVHGAMTTAIIALWTFNIALALIVGALEIVAHILIDRVKASPNMFGRFKDMTSPIFWNCLGADQLAHNLCYGAIVYAVFGYCLCQ